MGWTLETPPSISNASMRACFKLFVNKGATSPQDDLLTEFRALGSMDGSQDERKLAELIQLPNFGWQLGYAVLYKPRYLFQIAST